MFLDICDIIKINGVTDDTIRLRLFPFSLRDQARGWLQSLQPGSITTWQDMAKKFLAKFFPLAKTTQLRSEIGQFKQTGFESLYEAWERFKDLIRGCPQHGLPDWLQVQMFYNGLNGQTRTIVDVAIGGTLMSKIAEGATSLLEEMASNNYQWPTERSTATKVDGIHELEPLAALSAQVAYLSHQISTLTTQGIPPSVESRAAASMLVLGNETKFFFYRNTKNVQQPPPRFDSQPSEKKMSLEDAMVSFVEETKARFKKHDSGLDKIETHYSNMGDTMKNLEVQIGKLATTINAQERGTFPSNSEMNPKEQCKAITLRNGREIEMSPSNEIRYVPTTALNGQSNKKTEEERTVAKTLKEADKPPTISFTTNLPTLSTHLLYPQHFQKQKLDEQFSKFLEIFKKIQINIPFVDALEQMSNYVKFLKDIISKKRRLDEFETVKLTEESSAILQKKLPQKLKDPGSFTLPCTIGNSFFDKVLCDLRASINLMPISVCRKLGLGELKQTTISLQLADRMIKYPHGITEDVLVKVDKFIFPADFVMLDMEEDQEVPLILGRPFLATERALIDVQKGELILRVNKEEVMFNIHQAMRFPEETNTCFRVDVIEQCVEEAFQENLLADHLE
ncbi:hypothetical protein UlMin_008828 [Ulmus minor]